MTTKRKMAKDFRLVTLTLYGITYKVSELSPTMQNNCKLHGLCQKLIDSTAGMNSKDYTDEERADKVAEVWTTLKTDQWTKPGEGKATMKKKLTNALANATITEAKMMLKLGLVSREEFDDRRVKLDREAAAKAKK
jgi:hypothetical protein